MMLVTNVWHWFEIWRGLLRFLKIRGNLESVATWHLGLTIWGNGQSSSQVVNTKVVHTDEVLDEVQRVGRVWFEKLLIKGLKVGMLLKMSHVTIITCHNVFDFSLI
jgi:hypothetical protein